jgi:hypothetical protein
MRRSLLAALLLLAPILVQAQERDTTRRDERRQGLPREVAREVVDLFNETAALRVTGQLDIPADREVDGDVAVLDGPLTIAGRVKGRVLAINADVTLRPSARVDGDVIVVGGVLDARDARVDGEMRVYRQPLLYHQEGDRIVADDPEDEDSWRRAFRRRSRRTQSKLALGSFGTYNRVEGLPLYFGPSVRQNTHWGRVSLNAFGVFRTADNFRWDSDNLGHSVGGELRLGRGRGLVLRGRLFDVVEPVESWQLTDLEVGLASFFLHRDFRDYYNRHGGSATVGLLLRDETEFSLSLSDERWATREDRDPWTLFRGGQDWRPNPTMDEGRLHLANATLRVDTRNDEVNPWAGWFIVADVERGTGDITRYAPTTTVRPQPPRVEYMRGFLDLRRYNRLGPSSQLNVRAVVGGWLGGDPLPLQRRVSVSGPGTLPGFDFRRPYESADLGTCSVAIGTVTGVPAECERMALAQAEYRGAIHVNLFGDDDDWTWDERWGLDWSGEWIVFADAGRGWLVGPGDATELTYPKGDFPSLGTFRTDVGLGLDLGVIGLYLAKSLSKSDEPANFFVRVRHRF